MVIFAPSLQDGMLGGDVMDANVLGDPRDDEVEELAIREGAVESGGVTVVAERSAFHATDESPSSSIPARFPLVWRVTVSVAEPVRLPAHSDGPFRAPAWLADAVAVARSPVAGWWDWPVDVTVVGSFVNADTDFLGEVKRTLRLSGGRSTPRLDVVTTGAGLHQVRLRLRAFTPEELDEVAGTALASLDEAGALVHREDHRAFLAALHQCDGGD